jgi:hypothetical protein
MSDWRRDEDGRVSRERRRTTSYDARVERYERSPISISSWDRDRPRGRTRRETPIIIEKGRESVYSTDSEVRYRPRRRTRLESPIFIERERDYYTDDEPRHRETRESYGAKYMQALDQNGKELTIDVDLNTARGSLGFLPAKTISRQATSRILELEKDLEKRYNLEKVDRFDILTARRYLMDGKESAILDYRRSTRVDTTTQFRWMYDKPSKFMPYFR